MCEERIRYQSVWFCSVQEVKGFFLVFANYYSRSLLVLRLVPVPNTSLISAVIFSALGGSHLCSLFNAHRISRILGYLFLLKPISIGV